MVRAKGMTDGRLGVLLPAAGISALSAASVLHLLRHSQLQLADYEVCVKLVQLAAAAPGVEQLRSAATGALRAYCARNGSIGLLLMPAILQQVLPHATSKMQVLHLLECTWPGLGWHRIPSKRTG
jgi:hypothetical protein